MTLRDWADLLIFFAELAVFLGGFIWMGVIFQRAWDRVDEAIRERDAQRERRDQVGRP